MLRKERKVAKRNQIDHKKKAKPMKTGSIVRIIAAVILCFIGILGSLHLKASGVISELSLVTLISLSAFIGLIVFLSNRITHFSVSKLEVTLKEMKETEASVKELGRAVLDVIDKNSGFLALESFDQKGLDDAKDRLRKLIANN